MKFLLLLFLAFALMATPARAKEAYVSLQAYVTNAEAIAICIVENDNGDGTVTARIIEVLKGNLGQSEVIRGETGHCIIQGPVSEFMKRSNTYLVFLFKENTVGRLGGILEIEEDTVYGRYISGFEGTTFDKATYRHALPLANAKQQIAAILQKSVG